ncbi:hypothetical protein ACIRRH_36010 [Kitasatospora sp. NPDC101235]|uniref:hypothetical protein n=1 Tax=Kitasatospora sp. NPDC101235 TaxID=3364101 RepID=UPI00380D02C9
MDEDVLGEAAQEARQEGLDPGRAVDVLVRGLVKRLEDWKRAGGELEESLAAVALGRPLPVWAADALAAEQGRLWGAWQALLEAIARHHHGGPAPPGDPAVAAELGDRHQYATNALTCENAATLMARQGFWARPRAGIKVSSGNLGGPSDTLMPRVTAGARLTLMPLPGLAARAPGTRTAWRLWPQGMRRGHQGFQAIP